MAEFAATRKTIETHFQDNWTSTEVEYENAKPFRKQQAGSLPARFVRLRVVEAGRQQIALGTARAIRAVGLVVVQILVPRNDGSRESLKLADLIAAIFDRVCVNNVQFRVAEVQPVGATDEWWATNVSVPFLVTET